MFRRIALAVVVTLVASACGNSVDAVQQLKDAGAALKGLSSAQMDIKFGPGATATAEGFTVDLVSGTARVKLPGDSDLLGKVKQGDNVLEVRLVTLAGDTFLKFTSFLPARKLSAAEAQQYPSAARVLDRDKGLAAALPKGQNARVTGAESIDGHDCNRVEADYKPDDVKDAFTPFTPADSVHAILWVDKSDHLVRKARINGHIFSASDSFIEVHLHDFNSAVDIVRPA
jgi:hypothetical protein